MQMTLPPYFFELPGSVLLDIGTSDPEAPRRGVGASADRVDVSWTNKPLDPDSIDGVIATWDVYPGEDGRPENATVWVKELRKDRYCVSPPEWQQFTQPYRAVMSITPGYAVVTTGGGRLSLAFSPIPDEQFDAERHERAQLFQTDPQAYRDTYDPACTARRIATLISDLARAVPAGYAHPRDTDVPDPEATKYPDTLEMYFAAMDHHGLTGQTHLFPSAGPISRDEALQIRAALTDRERTNAGRIARSPSPHRYWVTGLFPITARGHWGLAVDVSTSATRGSLWAYYGGEDTLMKIADSLCDYLDDAVTAYRTGGTLQRYVLNTDTGQPRWYIPDRNSNTLIPEPRDL